MSSSKLFPSPSPPFLLTSKTLISTPNLLRLPLRRRRRRHLAIALATNEEDDAADLPDRLIAAALYLYPLVHGLHFGRFVLSLDPPLQPLSPAVRLFSASPFTPPLLFFALYFAVVRNRSAFGRYVRFNAMQAIVLDVLLVFPDLIERNFGAKGGIWLDVVRSFDSGVFLFLVICVVYGWASCLIGQMPRLPVVAEVAEICEELE